VTSVRAVVRVLEQAIPFFLFIRNMYLEVQISRAMFMPESRLEQKINF
jgi:hypothetical protein